MSAVVLLDPDCCGAGREPERALRAAGGKAFVVSADHESLMAAEQAWRPGLFALSGMDPRAAESGLPVPLLAEVAMVAVAAQEVGAQRWDAVVLRGATAATTLRAPELVDAVARERLAQLAPDLAAPGAATTMADLLRLRRDLAPLVGVAEAARVVGTPAQHAHRACPGPAWHACGYPVAPAHDVLGPTRPGRWSEPVALGPEPAERDVPAARATIGFRWWLRLPEGIVPSVEREGTRVLVRLREEDGRHRVAAFTLPPALARCRASSATVTRDAEGPLLRVDLRADPGLW